MKAIVGGTVYTPGQTFPEGCVLFDGEKILEVGEINIPEETEIIDAKGCHVIPGFVDVHIHGVMGFDSMGSDLSKVIESLPRFGVTCFMATTLTMPEEEVLSALEDMATVLADPPTGARCAGIHIEGPHLSPKKPGMATADWFKPLTAEDFDRYQAAAGGAIRMLTFAPEFGNAMAAIPHLAKNNVVPVIGHSDASYEQVSEAVSLGLNHATHTYNAMRGLHHREPGVVGAVMAHDEIFAELVADGIHVHPAPMKILLRVKGLSHTVLISDASPYAGMPEGEYEWERKPLFVKDGACRLADGTIAGAHALLDTGVRNLVSKVGLPLADALVPATAAAADSVGLADKGRLQAGADSDIVLLDQDLYPVKTFVKGNLVWEAAP